MWSRALISYVDVSLEFDCSFDPPIRFQSGEFQRDPQSPSGGRTYSPLLCPCGLWMYINQ